VPEAAVGRQLAAHGERLRRHADQVAGRRPVGVRRRPGEGGGHGLDGLEAVVGDGRHRLAHDRVQVPGHTGAQRPRRDGGGGVDPGRPAGEHGVEAGADAVDVGAPVGLLAADHLGGEEAVGAEDLAGAAGVVVGRGPGDGEVGHLHGAVVGEQDVARLEAAVADAGLVGVVEGAADLAGQPRRPRRRQRPVPGEHLAEGGPVDHLHDDVGDPALLAGVVQGDDVRVGQPRGVDGLVVETGPEALVGGQLRMQHLDDHMPAEDAVVATPDTGHATRRKLLAELVTLGEQPGKTGADLRHAHTQERGVGPRGSRPSQSNSRFPP
jgi:hypothetical protein